MDELAYTYATGFTASLPPSKPFTTRDCVALIDSLEDAFAKIGKTRYRFFPEPITEGGLQLDWPGRQPGEYKCMRFAGRHGGEWPGVNPRTRWEWEEEP